MSRTLLNERFLANLHRRLTLVEAPAGYGKTTLMQEWAAHLAQAGEETIWVQIGMDAVQALAIEEQVHLALTTPQSTAEDPQQSEPQSAMNGDGGATLPSILRILASAPNRTFLFFDDVHECTPAEVEFVQKLMLQSDDRTHIVIGTRETLGIPLTKMRLEERITDFGVEDLRFSRAEVEALLADRVTQEQIDTIFDYSEGWVAALQLLRQDGGLAQSLEFDQHRDLGGQVGIAQYLNEQFFEKLTPEQQSFLIDTAHLSTINGDLADYVRQDSGSWEILVGLAGAHSLVFELPAEDGYRYHQLLRDFLRKRQANLGDSSVRDLNIRTAEWCYQNDRLVSALRHAIAAKDTERAVQMILQSGAVLIGVQQGAPRLAACLEQIPINLVHRTPRLIIAWAYLLLKKARMDEAVLYLDEARQSLDHADEETRRELVLVEVHQRLYEDQHLSEAQLLSLEHTARTTPVTDVIVRALFANFLCIFHIQAGNLERARDYGDTAMALSRDLNVIHLQFFMNLHLSVVDLDWGDYEAALEKRKLALEITRTYYKHDPALGALADIYIGEIAYEMGETDGLEERLSNALELAGKAEGWSEAFLSGYETCLNASLATRGFEAAIDHIAEAETTAARRSSRRFARQLRILELELALDAGNGPQVDRLVAQIEHMLKSRDERNKLRWRGRILARHALARVGASNGDTDSALKVLEEVAQECRANTLGRYLLRTEILRVIVAAQAEDYGLANQCLKAVLDLAQSNNLGAFLRHGAAFAQAARDCLHKSGLATYSRDETRRLAEVLWACTGYEPKDEYTVLAELLTAREYAVLRLIARGDANKVIARDLDLSEATVKFHLKNVFAKLGVNNRKLAAEIAQQHGVEQAKIPFQFSGPLQGYPK